jgi:choline dehydrogenase-like flavoprotein
MHVDAKALPDQSVIEGDVCIVGAGAAGISIALDWVNSNSKVILLESGGFSYEDQVQDLYKGDNTGQKYYPLRASRLSYFGGTTGHWAGMCSPFDEIDFTRREWVPDSGWPINRKDLDAFYARAHQILKLGPYQYDLAYWRKQTEHLNAFPLDENIIWHKMWQISGVGSWSENGGMGTYYKDAILQAKNIYLYTHATVVDILTNENISMAQELTIKNFAGKTHTVKAKQFILAGGAIQNARMLLAANSQAPQGLGNNYGNVGRYFMEHLEMDTAQLWLLQPFETDLFTWGKLWCELAITPKVQKVNQILNGTVSQYPLFWTFHSKPRIETFQNEDPRKSIDNVVRSLDEARKKGKQENTGSTKRAYGLQTRLEQAPNPDSRITIGSEKDELGVPRANLHWRLTDLDKRSIRRINQIIGQEMGRAGIGRVKLTESLRDENDYTWPTGTNGGWHHMGTTRMSDNPTKGVVDSNCEVHGIYNLHIAGASCYPTSGAVNPTLTLVALSLRLSDYVKTKLQAPEYERVTHRN